MYVQFSTKCMKIYVNSKYPFTEIDLYSRKQWNNNVYLLLLFSYILLILALKHNCVSIFYNYFLA